MFNLKNFGDGICNTFGEGNILPLVWLPYDDHDKVKDPFFLMHPRKYEKLVKMLFFQDEKAI